MDHQMLSMGLLNMAQLSAIIPSHMDSLARDNDASVMKAFFSCILVITTASIYFLFKCSHSYPFYQGREKAAGLSTYFFINYGLA